MLNTAYKCASADIVFEEFEGDLVVLNLASGRYFGFNKSAASIWNAMMQGVRPSTISAVGPGETDIRGFVDTLLANELVVANADINAPLDTAQIADLEADRSAPVVEVYDDLADLIVADPIHDVDAEAGWPVKPE
ncbi:PqqD family protein [Candidatus Halocynthiibacter alkanivorans]|uniref:PqqD family protein n=1 Tax=Candidatus Halocynthiibacter alkanivorans TaxID=2267619 RepID=UPI000DF18C9F|nr:PqqD family protein [Candidatus Halocynthiibacter alkanivorans]